MSGSPPPPPPRGRQPPDREHELPPPPPGTTGPPSHGRAGSDQPAQELETASLALRLGAKTIDWLILLIVLGLVSAPLFLILLVTGSPSAIAPWSANRVEHLGVRAVWAGVTVAYFTWTEATRGRTPGKRVLHLTVVDERGGVPTAAQAFLRNLWMGLFLVPWIGVPAQVLAAAAIAVTVSHDSEGRGWHDLLADTTRVVRGP